MHSKGMVVGPVCLFVCLFVFLLEYKDDRSCTRMHAMKFASVAPSVCISVLFIKFMYLCTAGRGRERSKKVDTTSDTSAPVNGRHFTHTQRIGFTLICR